MNQETIELLKKMRVDVNSYIVKRQGRGFEYVIVGGHEVLSRKEFKDSKDEELEALRKTKGVDIIGEEVKLLPFIYVEDMNINVDNLKKILSSLKKGAVSKDKAHKLATNTQVLIKATNGVDDEPQLKKPKAELSALGLNLPTKEELEEKLVYIYEENPSTNSLALAKQFDIIGKNVIQSLMNILSLYPSLINSVRVGSYSTKAGSGTTSLYNYYEISEEVYNKFINSMGEPKSKGMRIYRTEKREEYFKGFQDLRQHLYNKGYMESEIENFVYERVKRERKHNTKELQRAIYDFVTHYNNSVTEEKRTSIPVINRIFFNLINRDTRIDAIDYAGGNDDRVVAKRLTQDKLVKLEESMAISLDICKDFLKTDTLVDVLLKTFSHSIFRGRYNLLDVEMLVLNYLMDYNAEQLWVSLPGYEFRQMRIE